MSDKVSYKSDDSGECDLDATSSLLGGNGGEDSEEDRTATGHLISLADDNDIGRLIGGKECELTWGGR